jgi:hypothetical protein
MVINPVSTHKTIIHPLEPISRIIGAVTMKIPDPIIDPATSNVASNNPNDCFNFDSMRAFFWLKQNCLLDGGDSFNQIIKDLILFWM